MNGEENGSKLDQVIAKAWADASFKERLKANPNKTLQAEGIECPPGPKIKVLENTEGQINIVIPAGKVPLPGDSLDKVAGGIFGQHDCEKAGCNHYSIQVNNCGCLRAKANDECPRKIKLTASEQDSCRKMQNKSISCCLCIVPHEKL